MEYLVFVGAIIGVLIVLKLLAWPLKQVIKVMINIAFGIILLFLFNYLGASVLGFIVPINWITALVVGVLGVPGLICVILYTMFFI